MRLREGEGGGNHAVGDLGDAGSAVRAGAGSVCRVGDRGDQDRLHESRRSEDGGVLSSDCERGGEAEDGDRLSRGVQANGAAAGVSERADAGGSDRGRAEWLERSGESGAPRAAAFHSDGGGADGLHPGDDEQRAEAQLPSGGGPADGPGDAGARSGAVRDPGEPDADAARCAVGLLSRAGVHGVHRADAGGVGRDAGAGGEGGGLRGAGAAAGRRVVCRRDHGLGGAGVRADVGFSRRRDV